MKVVGVFPSDRMNRRMDVGQFRGRYIFLHPDTTIFLNFDQGGILKGCS
jgi:hypothetical protein